MGSTIMRYQDIVFHNVRDALWGIKERGGFVTHAWLDAKLKDFRGEWAEDSMNVALLAIGRKPRYVGTASEAQLASLVERVKQRERLLLLDIAALRAARKASQDAQAAAETPPPVLNLHDDAWVDANQPPDSGAAPHA